MIDFLILGTIGLAALMFFKFKNKKQFPRRIFEIEMRLKQHADLWRHRNKDIQAAEELEALAKALNTAQLLLNEKKQATKAHWSGIRPSLLHLSGEDGLKKIDLLYSPQRNEYVAAIHDLVDRLDKNTGIN